jgi:integrase
VSPTGARPIADFTHLMERLDHASGVTGWTVHDLRRTARSLIGRADVPVDHAERCLAHTIGGVRGVYDVYEYMPEKRIFSPLHLDEHTQARLFRIAFSQAR